MAQKIIYWLLIALILSLGFGQLLRFEYFGVPIYLHDILVITILALQVPYLVQNYKVRNLVIPPSLKTFLAGLAIGWLYALFLYPLSSLLIPSLYTLRLLAYLALYKVTNHKSYLINQRYFLISGSIALLIGLLQYYLLPDMRVFQYLGWDDHLNRLTLPHFDPTFTAVTLALTLLSVSSISYFLPPIFLLAILLTYSRSVWLSLFLTGVFSLRNKKIILASSILLLVSILALPQKFGEGTNLLRTYSITSRFDNDLAYIQKYQWDLLIGRGLNTLVLDSPSSSRPIHASGPNNSYLYLLATTGVMGLAGWGIFMYLIFQKSTHKPLLIFFFIASLFNNVMFYPFALLWVMLIESGSRLESSN